jgi:hypothetical protein
MRSSQFPAYLEQRMGHLLGAQVGCIADRRYVVNTVGHGISSIEQSTLWGILTKATKVWAGISGLDVRGKRLSVSMKNVNCEPFFLFVGRLHQQEIELKSGPPRQPQGPSGL